MVDPAMFSQTFWDDRYRSREHLWSGTPNPQLVAEASDLAPGRALDVGCGEGADVIWLAERGWTVTGSDISPVALERAAAHAEQRGRDVADRISWRQVDLFATVPVELAEYNLVSSQFVHLPPDHRAPVVGRLAAAVAPSGHLLYVAHDRADLEIPGLRPHVPEMFASAEQLAELLDPADWEILVAEARGRPGRGPDGAEITVHDAVLHARRR